MESSSICTRTDIIFPPLFGVVGGVFAEDMPLPSTPAGVDCACANLLLNEPDAFLIIVLVYVARPKSATPLSASNIAPTSNQRFLHRLQTFGSTMGTGVEAANRKLYRFVTDLQSLTKGDHDIFSRMLSSYLQNQELKVN